VLAIGRYPGKPFGKSLGVFWAQAKAVSWASCERGVGVVGGLEENAGYSWAGPEELGYARKGRQVYPWAAVAQRRTAGDFPAASSGAVQHTASSYTVRPSSTRNLSHSWT